MRETTKIDFVLPWVDGSNPEWRERYLQYSHPKEGDNRDIRFRDWDLLRYWFRSIEKFTPWVNNIYFITSGEYPEWLNLEHPKLKWIKHEEYIPGEYLPTFNSHTIELNLHRIKELSDTFVYFNDDFFIVKPVRPSRFFVKNLPCDYGVQTAKPAGKGIIHIAINNLDVINDHFKKHVSIKKNPLKWFSLKYGKGIINNILLYPWIEFSGFVDPHIPQAFLKNSFNNVWAAEPQLIGKTCSSKFRTNENVNQWLIRYWQFAEGRFHPKNIKKKTMCTDIKDETLEQICTDIQNQNYEIICLNDSEAISDFEKYKKLIQESFEHILPQKSSFEL